MSRAPLTHAERGRLGGIAARGSHSRYSEEEVERGLLVLALCGGRSTRASQQLAELGHPIPAPTLCKWRDETHADRYTQIATDQQAKVRERIAAQHEQVVFAATEAQQEALDQFRTHLAHGDIPRDKLAGDIRNLATAAGINADKANLARGQATTIVEHRAPDEVIAALKGIGFGVIEGTAEPIQDAEQVDEVQATSIEGESQRPRS